MKRHSFFGVVSAHSLLLLTTMAALADWPSDPAANLAVADRTGEQVQAKIAPTDDGGCYVSWFDNAAGGYDVYLQHLDAGGNELWGHNGVLIADRSFSSTEDYGLDVDAAGNAVLAFRDDRSGSTLITAALVAPDGTLTWGSNGVQLSSAGDDVYSPRIAGTSDGGIVVGWFSSAEGTVLQKIDTSGTPLWHDGVILADTGTAYYTIADLHGSDAGSVIVSWVRWGPMYYNPRNLMTQKLDADGNALWGSSHVVIFDADSLQFGNYPPFITDGGGGAVFSWYGTSPLQCYAQHVLSDGSLAFGENGVAVSTDTANVRVSPSAAYNATTEETFVFWTEEDSLQSQDGVYGQKLDASGAAQWGGTGKTLVAVSSSERTFIQTLPIDDGALVFFIESPSYGNDVIYATRVDKDGDFVWIGDLIYACSLVSDKLRLKAALSWGGGALLAWGDGRFDSGDVYMQNINPDGTLGGCASVDSDLDCDGDVDLADLQLLLSAYGTHTGDPSYIAGADFDADGDVDLADLQILLADYGAGA